jgi:protein-ribulosamine 3-kinase
MTASIPQAIVVEIEGRTDSVIKAFSFASGGCINHGGRVTTSQGNYFLKWNDLGKFPGMFAAEAKGLDLLGSGGTIMVPKVINVGTAGPFQFLLLEHIDSGKKTFDFWDRFGTGLARLHKRSSTHFGLDHHNYIGSLPQRNTESTSWTEFFIQERLLSQLRIARDAGKIDHSLVMKFDALFNRLPSLLPEEPPSLLHGDLWGGNLITTSAGGPCLIDPAVYYGNREMDLAMTQLFGGFDPFYLESYKEVYPLHPAYEERLDLYNLYPLLVHVNLFGGGYKDQVVSILNRFVR